LMVLLAGCVTVPIETPAPAAKTARAVAAPILPDPPPGVVDALQAAGRTDPSVAAWVVDLDNFYQKQDAARAAK
jgi:hypothetical protein